MTPNTQNREQVIYEYRLGKSKWTAFWLCFFVGGLGIHRFYLGDWKGILYVLFVWTFIPAIIALIELFIIGFMDPREFDKRYNTIRNVNYN